MNVQLCWLTYIERSGHLPICSCNLLFGAKQLSALLTSQLAYTYPNDHGLAEVTLEVNQQGFLIVTDMLALAPVIDYSLYAKAIAQLDKGSRPLLSRFVQLLALVTAPDLQSFIDHWTTHPEQFEAYLAMPASYRDHHAYRHGLMQHSLEVAELAYNNALSLHHSPWECQLALLAGLFHDIGKIYSRSEGRQVQYQPGAHECLNFSLLAEPLRQLALKDWDAHQMLSSMLAPYQQHRSEQYAVEAIFRNADRASCASNRTHVMFADKPPYFRFVKDGQRMLRRLPTDQILPQDGFRR